METILYDADGDIYVPNPQNELPDRITFSSFFIVEVGFGPIPERKYLLEVKDDPDAGPRRPLVGARFGR